MSDCLLLIERKKNNESKMFINDFENTKMVNYCNFHIAYQSEQKFKYDCIFQENEQYVIIQEGVVLNSRILLEKYQKKSLADLILYLYDTHSEMFFEDMEGSFYGVFIDKKKNKLMVYTDKLGNHPIYYFTDDNRWIISNKIKSISSFLKKNELHSKVNLVGAYSMLTYGYMYADFTLIEGTKRLLPGYCLLLENNNMDRKQFYKMPKITKSNCSISEIVNQLDDLFCEAIRLQVDKNNEYSYKNWTALSAGLDSRMVLYAMKKSGAKDVIAYTYSETGQLDERIPMQIAKELKFRWFFKGLDNGLDLLDIQESIGISDGRCYYPWVSQLNDFMKYVNKNDMGLVHTGVIGDIIVGTFCHNEEKISASYEIGDGAYSTRLINRLRDLIECPSTYGSYENGMLFNRAFNGACIGYSTTFQEYTEALSPFMYTKFFEFCLSLPQELRYQHDIYYRWVRRFYPEAAHYSHNGLKIQNKNQFIKLKGKKIYIDTIPSRILNILQNRLKSRNGMNPMEYWFKENKELEKTFDSYFNQKKELVSQNKMLSDDIEQLYISGSVLEKTLCLSLLGSLDLLFKDSKII